jgi:hypothetical protein
MTAPGSVRRVSPRIGPHRFRPTVGAGLALTVAAALPLALAGCASQAAFGLVQQACHHVDLSLALYRSSQHQTDPALAARDLAQAGSQLQVASPLATQAAGEAPQWQALMATLAENTRLPESDLVYALRAQCSAVDNGGLLVPSVGPTPTTTLPPPPSGDRG